MMTLDDAAERRILEIIAKAAKEGPQLCWIFIRLAYLEATEAAAKKCAEQFDYTNGDPSVGKYRNEGVWLCLNAIRGKD